VTLGEVKARTLQKMSLDCARPWEPCADSLCAAVDEGLRLLAVSARPRIAQCTIRHDEASEDGAWRRHDLYALVERYFRLHAVYLLRGGTFERTAHFTVTPDGALLLPGHVGAWQVYCAVYPTTVTAQTPDSTELDADPDGAALLPLYAASQLFKEDDPAAASLLRSEFELGLQRLAVTAPGAVGGVRFRSVRGW